MSFRKTSPAQMTISDSYFIQSPRTKKIIEKSWCKDFADIVYPAINEERFAALYSKNDASRPNTSVRFIVGALILKEDRNLTDDELIESICCDVRFQYALHTTHLPEQPVGDRTFSRFRERCYNFTLETGIDLLTEEMEHLASEFAKYMNLTSNIKRMDSLMISSRCKSMSRLEIVYQVCANAVRLIHRLGMDELIPDELAHFLEDDDLNQTIYHCKGEETDTRLAKTIKEAYQIKGIMSDDAWYSHQEYQLLIRVLLEQTQLDDDGNPGPKDKKDISASSLQNPSDPDATYRKKAGKDHKGYVGNLVETVGENGDSLITEIDYDVNTHSDSAFYKAYIDRHADDAEPEINIADGAYGGHENMEAAAAKNIKLITTSLTGKIPDPIFASYILSEDGTGVELCPAGNTPVKQSYYDKTGMIRAVFASSSCRDCPHRDECNPKCQKNTFVVTLSRLMVERAAYVEKITLPEYQELAKLRNAIEGIPSVLRRKYHIDSMPVCGLIRTRQLFALKVGAYNFVKVRKHSQRKRKDSAQNQEIA